MNHTEYKDENEKGSVVVTLDVSLLAMAENKFVSGNFAIIVENFLISKKHKKQTFFNGKRCVN